MGLNRVNARLKTIKSRKISFSGNWIYLFGSIMVHFNAQTSCLFSLLIWSHCVGYPVKFKSYCPLRGHVTVLFCSVLYISLSTGWRLGFLHHLLWVFSLFSIEKLTCWIPDATSHMALSHSSTQQEHSRILRRSTLGLYLPCPSLSVIHRNPSSFALKTKNLRNQCSDQASRDSLFDICRWSSLFSLLLEMLVPSLVLSTL